MTSANIHELCQLNQSLYKLQLGSCVLVVVVVVVSNSF